MTLNSSQMVTFATNIRANTDPVVIAARTSGNDEVIANWYNEDSTSWVWKSYVSEDSIYSLSGFDWTLVDGLTVGKRDEWNMLFKLGRYAPSKSNQRAAIIDIWVGTTAKVAVQTAIFVESKRLANRLEALFLTATDAGVGADGTQAKPMNMIIEGLASGYQVNEILRNY